SGSAKASSALRAVTSEPASIAFDSFLYAAICCRSPPCRVRSLPVCSPCVRACELLSRQCESLVQPTTNENDRNRHAEADVLRVGVRPGDVCAGLFSGAVVTTLTLVAEAAASRRRDRDSAPASTS